jgi:hypothetical protein
VEYASGDYLLLRKGVAALRRGFARITLVEEAGALLHLAQARGRRGSLSFTQAATCERFAPRSCRSGRREAADDALRPGLEQRPPRWAGLTVRAIKGGVIECDGGRTRN